MIKRVTQITVGICLTLVLGCSAPTPPAQKSSNSHEQLVEFFGAWRKFQAPIMNDGVPDYSTTAMNRQHLELANWQKQLKAFDTTGWPVKHQVDYYLVWAEMNGLDFDHRVLRPWVRDPAFYVWFYPSPSDVPKREGPAIFGAIELSQYKQPWSAADAMEIVTRLQKAKSVFEQAKINLTGNGKDLWIYGTRSIREQSNDLSSFASSVGTNFPDLASAAREAAETSNQFAAWLDQQAPSKKGQSGIGKDDYTWYIRNVHLVPYTWQSEKTLLERELARSHSALRLAEHRNRNLPKLNKASNEVDYKSLLTKGVDEYMEFLEKEDFLTVKPYMKPAMMAQVKKFVPSDGLRGFFDEIDYRDPMPMRAHHYHWIEKEREIQEPNPSAIRRTPLLYNIFDSRAEGMATAMEELVMNAGLLKDRPRATELVYIMLAERAARGLGGLYQHGLEMDFKQATEYADTWVPWGLLPADGSTIQHEEHFYLQQPGYGSSYIVGKADIDKLIAEYARQREGKFSVKEFMDEFNRVGIIPVSLIYWQMTGSKDLLNEALKSTDK
jgi:hypothetical protein